MPNWLMPPGNTVVAAGTVNVSVVQAPAVGVTLVGDWFQLAQLLDCVNNCTQAVVPTGTHT
jgi:hypothetical protein